MKTRIIFCFFFLVFMLANGNAFETRPIAVSPGSKSGIAVVRQSCPTFSWSAVQGAEAYRIMVFKAVSRELLAYEEMDVVAVLTKIVQGQQKAIEEQQRTISELKEMIAELKVENEICPH